MCKLPQPKRKGRHCNSTKDRYNNLNQSQYPKGHNGLSGMEFHKCALLLNHQKNYACYPASHIAEKPGYVRLQANTGLSWRSWGFTSSSGRSKRSTTLCAKLSIFGIFSATFRAKHFHLLSAVFCQL